MTGSSDSTTFRGRWTKATCQVPGSGHIERAIPCQDRAGAWLTPRPALVILDGRGSARLSHLGAAAALARLKTMIRKWELELASVLDEPGDALATVGWRGLSQMFYHAAAAEQPQLAVWQEAKPSDFEFTLTLAVMGRVRMGWLAVGDSPLVVSRNGVSGLVTPLENAAFANQTTFVTARPGSVLGLSGGLVNADDIDAVLAMTDGTASRMVDLRNQVPAPAVAQVAGSLATGRWQARHVKELLAAPEWAGITRDDRSLAILARRTRQIPSEAAAADEYAESRTRPESRRLPSYPTNPKSPESNQIAKSMKPILISLLLLGVCSLCFQIPRAHLAALGSASGEDGAQHIARVRIAEASARYASAQAEEIAATRKTIAGILANARGLSHSKADIATQPFRGFGNATDCALMGAKDKLSGGNDLNDHIRCSMSPVTGLLASTRERILVEIAAARQKSMARVNDYRRETLQLAANAGIPEVERALDLPAVGKMTKTLEDSIDQTIAAELGASLELILIKPTIEILARVLGPAIATAAGTAGAAGTACVVDGPIPIGDIIAGVIALGGSAWAAMDIWRAVDLNNQLPGTVETMLNEQISQLESATTGILDQLDEGCRPLLSPVS